MTQKKQEHQNIANFIFQNPDFCGVEPSCLVVRELVTRKQNAEFEFRSIHVVRQISL